MHAPPDNLHRKAFDNSLQANIIFIVSSGRIIRANRAACKLLGYSRKELLTKNRADIFSVSENSYKKMMRLRKAEGSVKADLPMIRKSGRILPCEITSVIFKDDDGINNSILSIVDLRERQSMQKKIDGENEKLVAGNIIIAQTKSDSRQAESDDWIKSVVSSSYDVIWDWDITADLLSFGKNYEHVFGYKLPEIKISFKEWMHLFPSEEKDSIKEKIDSIFETESDSWEGTYRFTGPNGAAGEVISRAKIVRDNSGKAIRMIGVIHDLSKMQKLEGILEQEMKIKEKQIVEAIVEAKEMERSDLGKELHDNVNQLLAISILYLDMARKDIKNGEIYLIHSSEYTLTAIEEIRKLTKGMTMDVIGKFGLCSAIEEISRDTMGASPLKIHCTLDHSLEEGMSEQFKLNAFRILQEQMNNILKHARASEVFISVFRAGDSYQLYIADDGVGFDTAKKSKGIGLGNIVSRAELYKGKAGFISAPRHGCRLTVRFPIAYAD